MKSNTLSTSLSKEFNLFTAVMVIIGNTVGSGIFTTSGFIIKELKDPGALLLVWFLGGLISLFGALSYAELGKMFPRAGGEYTFLKESFGEALGFIAGWISLVVGFSAPIAATAIAFSNYFLELFHIQNLGQVIKFKEVPIFNFTLSALLAILTIFLFSFIHAQRVKISAQFQTILTVLKLLFILSFLIFGFLSISEDLTQFEVKKFVPQKEAILNLGFPVSFIYVMYAYSGWNAITYIGEEVKDSKKNIPLSLILGILVITGLYLGLNLLYLKALTLTEMSGVLEIGAKTAQKIFGENFSFIFTFGITLGLLSGLSAMIIAGPRVYYAMARDGVFFEIFSRISPYTRTPVFSIFLQAVIAVFMVLTSSFEVLLLYIGFTLSLCASFTVLGLIKLKRKFIFSGIVFVLANFWIVIFTFISKPLTILVGTFTVLIGLFLYWVRFKRKVKLYAKKDGQGF